jgi:DNA repair protein RecN (Recombination protein N)
VIESLRITNLAVVEHAEIEFGPGLHALTGETGAGKSIVLGALALLAGGRATADVVRDGADEARVERCAHRPRRPRKPQADADSTSRITRSSWRAA